VYDLAYSLTAGKAHYNYRVGFAVSAIPEFERQRTRYLDEEPSIQPVRRHPLAVVFAFTGQGSFYSLMAAQLFKDSANFRHRILYFNAIAQRQGFESFVPVLD
jgi:acyl transferase domain-containing protein